MLDTTKDNIAASLRKMMMERPFRKITVQNLMDDNGMKRQSFYYHFQDTRDVLHWICDQRLCRPLRESELEFGDWVLYALELLDMDRNFYRRALVAADEGTVDRMAETVALPRVSDLLFPGVDPDCMDEAQCFAVRFGVRAITAYALDFTRSRRSLEPETARANLRCVMDALNLSERGKERLSP